MGTEGKKLTLPGDYGRLHRRGNDLLDKYEFAMLIGQELCRGPLPSEGIAYAEVWM